MVCPAQTVRVEDAVIDGSGPGKAPFLGLIRLTVERVVFHRRVRGDRETIRPWPSKARKAAPERLFFEEYEGQCQVLL
jgi:hypothetical protein